MAKRCILPAIVIAIFMGPKTSSAQDNAFDAWAVFFDAVSTDWRNPGKPSEDAITQLSPEDLRLISAYAHEPFRQPNAAERAAFERLDLVAPLLIEATRSRVYDPGNDFSQGVDLVLPHMWLTRQAAHCMTALARRAAVDGDASSAMEWTTRLTQSSGQIAQDQTMIGSLVGGSIFSTAEQQLGQMIDAGLLDRKLASEYVDRVQWIEAQEDPFGFVPALIMEREIMAMEMERIRQGILSGDDDRFHTLLDLVYDQGEGLPPMDVEELERQATVMDEMFADMVDAAGDPDRARGLATIEAIQAGVLDAETPTLMSMLIPDASSFLETRTRLETMLSDRMRIMQAVATGRLDIESIRNGATLWDRLGSWFERLPSTVQVAGLDILGVPIGDLSVDESDEAPDPPQGEGATDDLGNSMATWIAAVEPESESVMTLAADAAAVATADFPAGGAWITRLRLRGDDLDRIRAAGRGMLIDATVRLRLAGSIQFNLDSTPTREPDEPAFEDAEAAIGHERTRATTMLVSTIALIQDLVGDPEIAHVILATDLLGSLLEVLDSEDALPILRDPIRRDLIATALEAIPRKPALGIREAVDADRRRWVEDTFRGTEHEDTRDAVLRGLKNRGPNRILCLLNRSDRHLVIRTPMPDEQSQAPPTVVGPEPPQLIASSHGMYGDGWAVVPRPDDPLLEEVLDLVRSDPRSARRHLARLEQADPFPLADYAALGDDRLAGLDAILRELRARNR